MADSRVDILLALKSKIEGVDKVIDVLTKVGKASLIAGAAFAVFAAKTAISQSSQFVDAATRIETTVEAVQVLGRAAEDAGDNLGGMEKQLLLVKKNTVEAAQGNSKLTDAYATLQLNAKALTALRPDQIYEQIAFAVVNAKNQQSAYNAAVDILGTKQAPRLLEVLQRLGRVGYAGLRDEIQQTHGLISEETARTLEESGDRLQQLQNRFVVFAGETVAKLAPLITALETVARWAMGMIQGIQDLTEYAGASAANAWALVSGMPLIDLTQKDPPKPTSPAPVIPSGPDDAAKRDMALRSLQFELTNRRAELAQLDADYTRTDFQKRDEKLLLMREELRVLEEINAAKLKEEGPIGLNDAGGRRSDISPEDLKTLNEQNKRQGEIDQLKSSLLEIRLQFFDIQQTLQNGIGGAIQGLLTGTMSWGDAFRYVGSTMVTGVINAFANMASEFIARRTLMFLFGRKLDAAEVAAGAAKNTALTAQTVAKASVETVALTPPATLASISSFGLAAALGVAALAAVLAFREKGGPVTAGRPYIVGEKRPELFVPSVSGTILPSVPDMVTASRSAAPAASSSGGSSGAKGRDKEGSRVNVAYFNDESRAMDWLSKQSGRKTLFRRLNRDREELGVEG
ncbi:hypothetical protein [Oleiharenicola lentus]|uniref:hypothetical protein n=1 Tax=Oleiharenicola lentus TaxID=2508720 RepID=UPI003F66635B